jgi:hypothetical protein
MPDLHAHVTHSGSLDKTLICNVLHGQFSNSSATTPWPEKPEEQQEAEEELLQRLADQNHQRATQETQGKTHRLRPDYQAPEEATKQAELATEPDKAASQEKLVKRTNEQMRQPWPQTFKEPACAVRDEHEATSLNASAMANHFKRKPTKSLLRVLDALEELEVVDQTSDGTNSLKDSQPLLGILSSLVY